MKDFCHSLHCFESGIKGGVGAFFVIFFSLTLTSCRSARDVYIDRPVCIHDTMYVANVQKDSVYIHDSVNVYKNGDTVYMSKWRTRYVERLKTDTLTRYIEVPVETTVEVKKVVESPLKWYQKMQMWLGAIVEIVALGFAIAWFINREKR